MKEANLKKAAKRVGVKLGALRKARGLKKTGVVHAVQGSTMETVGSTETRNAQDTRLMALHKRRDASAANVAARLAEMDSDFSSKLEAAGFDVLSVVQRVLLAAATR